MLGHLHAHLTNPISLRCAYPGGKQKGYLYRKQNIVETERSPQNAVVSLILVLVKKPRPGRSRFFFLLVVLLILRWRPRWRWLVDVLFAAASPHHCLCRRPVNNLRYRFDLGAQLRGNHSGREQKEVVGQGKGVCWKIGMWAFFVSLCVRMLVVACMYYIFLVGVAHKFLFRGCLCRSQKVSG